MRRTILVVDPDGGMGRLLALSLAYHGYAVDVLVADDGQGARDLARREPPALVFVDLFPVEPDASAVCRLLKTDAVASAVPIVVLIDPTFPDEERAALAGGADASLAKPFTQDDLLALATRFLGPPPIDRNQWRCRDRKGRPEGWNTDGR